MHNDNPYASPPSDPHDPFASPLSGAAGFRYESTGEGLWRKGNLLVMDKFAPLPDRCVKSNEPAHGGKLKRRLSWHHPLLYLLALVSILIYVIVALIVQKRATIEIGLCKPWFSRRRWGILVGWATSLSGIGLIALGISGAQGGGQSNAAFIGIGITVFICGLGYGVLRSRMVTADRIDERYVWLRGVHPDFLAPLPEWPYNP